MPIPTNDRIGDWSSSQLSKFIQNAVLLDPPALPSSMSLDDLVVAGDLQVGGNALVNGLVKGSGGVATTVGPSFPVNPTGGQMHMLQLDVAPYLHELMVYDEKLMHWISAEPVVVRAAQDLTTTSSSFIFSGGGTPTGQPFLWVYQAKKFYEAGLRPQTRLSGWLQGAGGSNAAEVEVVGREINANDTSISGSTLWGSPGSSGDSQSASGVAQFKATGWVDREFNGTPSKAHWLVQLRIRMNGTGTANFQAMAFEFRWIK